MKQYLQIILEAMSYSQALAVYKKYGFDVDGVDAATLKNYTRAIVKKVHPDLGGDLEEMKSVNVAYDLLKNPNAVKSQPSAPWNTPNTGDYTAYCNKIASEMMTLFKQSLDKFININTTVSSKYVIDNVIVQLNNSGYGGDDSSEGDELDLEDKEVERFIYSILGEIHEIASEQLDTAKKYKRHPDESDVISLFYDKMLELSKSSAPINYTEFTNNVVSQMLDTFNHALDSFIRNNTSSSRSAEYIKTNIIDGIIIEKNKYNGDDDNDELELEDKLIQKFVYFILSEIHEMASEKLDAARKYKKHPDESDFISLFYDKVLKYK